MPWDFWLIFLFLGVLVPWRGSIRMKKLLEKASTSSHERISLYGSTMLMQWAVTAFAFWRARVRGISAGDLGLGGDEFSAVVLAALGGGLLFGVLHWRNLRRIARAAGPSAERMHSIGRHILPQSSVELIPYCGLAITAGVCEEFLYRGFGYAALTRVGLPIWLVVVGTSILFGLAHLYQGRGGVLGTAILGLLLACSRAVLGSLVPSIVWHSVIDLVAGIAGPRYLLRAAEAAKNL
jgi:membrane protease YdiL (CAAX protease family)